MPCTGVFLELGPQLIHPVGISEGFVEPFLLFDPRSPLLLVLGDQLVQSTAQNIKESTFSPVPAPYIVGTGTFRPPLPGFWGGFRSKPCRNPPFAATTVPDSGSGGIWITCPYLCLYGSGRSDTPSKNQHRRWPFGSPFGLPEKKKPESSGSTGLVDDQVFEFIDKVISSWPTGARGEMLWTRRGRIGKGRWQGRSCGCCMF